MRNEAVFVMAVAGLTIGGCGGEASSDASPGEAETSVPVESAPFHAVAAGALVVSGSAECEFSDEGVGVDGEPGGFLVVCELDLSDPRVSGTERHDRFRFVTERGAGTAWLVEDATIVNSGGS